MKMSINGVSANYYPTAYMNTNTPKSTETASFADTIVEKAAIGKIDYDERAFNFFAPNAPDEVREAWLEAAKETGANGMGMGQDGKLTHISSMMTKSAVNNYWNRETGVSDLSSNDLLGSTVVSALSAAKQALYDLEHPLEPISRRSWEVQKQIAKEREFYNAFIDKLEKLQQL